MTTHSSKSQSRENLIAGRYRIVTELYDEPLGKFCRALDIRDNQAVALLKLKQIIGRLPPMTTRRLQEAIEEARKISITTLLRVHNGNLSELYIAMEWIEGQTLREWLGNSDPVRFVHDTINLVMLIAHASHYPIKSNFKWVRPSLDTDKIYVQRTTSLSGDLPVLVDLGFTELLLDNPAYANGAPYDAKALIQQLAILLTSLLLQNLDLRTADWTDRSVVEARLAEIGRRYPDAPRGLRRILLLTLPGTVGDHFADPGAFAEELQKLLETPAPLPFLSPARETPTAPPALPADDASRSITAVVGVPPAPPSLTEPATPPATSRRRPKYRLQITDNKENDELDPIPLSDTVVTAGLSPDDKINLPRLAAQRLYFVQVEGRLGDRYTVTDTGNGATDLTAFALLDGVPLSPYYAALLREGSVIEIADYTLELLPGLETTTSPPPQQASPLQTLVREYSAQSGERIALSVHIQNQTQEVDRLWLVLDGAPAEWQVLTPPARQMFEGDEAELQVAIRLPLVPQSIAGLYHLTLRLISENLTAQIAAVNLYVELLPAYDFVGGLAPQIVRTGAPGTAYLENHGNLSRLFRLTWRDQGQELLFDPAESTLLVRAGEVGEVVYRAYARQWRWFGREKSHQFSLLAAPQGGGIPQSYSGQVLTRALVPVWALPVALLLAAVFFLLAATLFKPDFASRVVGPQGAAVAGTPFSLNWTPVNTCFAAIYENGLVRMPYGWRPGPFRYRIENPKAKDLIEVRLRNCLYMAEKSWSVEVAEAPPTPIAPPQIVTFSMATTPVVTPTLHLLVGQTGELCVQWEVTGAYKELQLAPPLTGLAALENAKDTQCVPIADAFAQKESDTSIDFKLRAIALDDQPVESTPVPVTVAQARCYVNTLDPIALYEGPGRMFPIRGYLQRDKDEPLFVLAQPFTLFEQNDNLRWVQLRLAQDPRPGWAIYDYLYCPQDIRVLPVVDAVPPTPLPTTTETPLPTPTPTATASPPPPPLVSVSPDVINLGGCTKVKWDIQNVKEVYLNGEGVIGVAEREVCPSAAGRVTYTWRIVQNDGNVMQLERQLLVNPGSGSGGPPTPPAN
ncbi:MAG: hypothetical protein R3C14_44645 [Caldilineaceae bacterium]